MPLINLLLAGLRWHFQLLPICGGLVPFALTYFLLSLVFYLLWVLGQYRACAASGRFGHFVWLAGIPPRA